MSFLERYRSAFDGGFLSVNPILCADFENTILDPLYSSINDPVPLANFEPHRLSLFFIVLGIGALFDTHPSARIIAEQYNAFACATFSLESILDGATCASIQALFMMAHFLLLMDRSGSERRWLISGLTAKVIHMVGWSQRGPLAKSDCPISLSVRVAYGHS